MSRKPKLIVILGPTACGKTSLAVKLTKIFNGEIISADSRQVYKGMDIGTGKDLKEYGDVPYYLIDIVSPKTQFSLAQYQKLAYLAIDDIIKRGKTPFLVGGTGLYLQAVIDGYVLANSKPNKKLRAKLNKKTLKQLQQLSKKYKIKLNQSDFNNKRRLIRAIEIRTYDQRPITIKKNVPRYKTLILGLKFPKKIINQRIDKRLTQRLEKEGMIKEVKKLRQSGISWKRLDDFGLEYRYLAKYLKGQLTYEQMVKQLAAAIHQFAKRQLTWFKKDKRINWLTNPQVAQKKVKKFLNS